jgi:hypothetical protein
MIHRFRGIKQDDDQRQVMLTIVPNLNAHLVLHHVTIKVSRTLMVTFVTLFRRRTDRNRSIRQIGFGCRLGRLDLAEEDLE